MERKLLPLTKAALTDAGEFSGYANVFDIVDRGGDRVRPGAFKDDINRFLADGFISWSHDWGVPVAMPMEAKEDATGLFIRCGFHTTPAAQEARTITAERLEAGKSMGLSIGYGVEGMAWVTEDGEPVRDLTKLCVYEVGLVMVPMNQESYVTDVKGGGQADRLPYASHLDWLTDEVRVLAERSRRRAEARGGKGRVLSEDNRRRLAALADGMSSVTEDLRALLAEADPEGKRLGREWDAIRARAAALGVPVPA